MATLLPRSLTESEKAVQANVRQILEHDVPATRPGLLARELKRCGPQMFFPAALSLIDLPPSSTLQRRLCCYLVETPGFLIHIGNPENFSRADLLDICRVLIKLVPRLDVAFVTTLSAWKMGSDARHHPTFLRVLDVLDELSPGGRLVMSLTRLLRDLAPELASKAVLSLGKRVQNPAAVARQLNSADSRVRANCLEAMWGSRTPNVLKLFRENLNDEDNRVVGNALMGLWLGGDRHSAARLFEMLAEPRGPFRQTAAWAMGRIADPRFQEALLRAVDDEDSKVRESVKRALERFAPDKHVAPRAVPETPDPAGELEWGAIWRRKPV